MNYQNNTQYSNQKGIEFNNQQQNVQPYQDGQNIQNQNMNYYQPTYQQNVVQPINFPDFKDGTESVSQDPFEPNQIVHQEQLKQQQQFQTAQYQLPHHPQEIQYQYIQANQQTIATPFIQPLIINNEEFLRESYRRDIILKINYFWIIQELIQITLCIVNLESYEYDNLFFDYYTIEYRSSMYIFFFLSFGFIIFVRFNKKLWKLQGKQALIYLTYSILYSVFISGIVSSSRLDFQNYESYFLIGFLYFIGTIGNLIMLIQFQIQIKKLNQDQMVMKEFIKGLLFGPINILFLISAFFGIILVSIVLFYVLIWSIIFTLFYINSLLQIYRGKFNLRREQYFVGVVLAYINMFIPFID